LSKEELLLSLWPVEKQSKLYTFMIQNHSKFSPELYSSPDCYVLATIPANTFCVSYGNPGEAGSVRDIVVIEEEF